MWSKLLYLSLSGAESKSHWAATTFELFQKLQTVDISSLKRATGVLRHVLLPASVHQQPSFFKNFHVCTIGCCCRRIEETLKRSPEISISHYLILNPTIFCSFHNGLTRFLGCTRKKSLFIPWIIPFVIIWMSPVLSLERLSAVVAWGSGVHCGMVSAGVSLVDA